MSFLLKDKILLQWVPTMQVIFFIGLSANAFAGQFHVNKQWNLLTFYVAYFLKLASSKVSLFSSPIQSTSSLHWTKINNNLHLKINRIVILLINFQNCMKNISKDAIKHFYASRFSFFLQFFSCVLFFMHLLNGFLKDIFVTDDSEIWAIVLKFVSD